MVAVLELAGITHVVILLIVDIIISVIASGYNYIHPSSTVRLSPKSGDNLVKKPCKSLMLHGLTGKIKKITIFGTTDRKSDALSPNWKNHYPPISGRLYDSGH